MLLHSLAAKIRQEQPMSCSKKAITQPLRRLALCKGHLTLRADGIGAKAASFTRSAPSVQFSQCDSRVWAIADAGDNLVSRLRLKGDIARRTRYILQVPPNAYFVLFVRF